MARYATEANLLPEQVHPFTAEPLAVTPLTWSHASFVSAVHDYLDRSAALGRIATETNTPHVRQG
jgi:GH15 family glucan-1,4-alpha-glucosidase